MTLVRFVSADGPNPPPNFRGRGTMRSMVEGTFTAKDPSTALRAVPLPGKGRGGKQIDEIAA